MEDANQGSSLGAAIGVIGWIIFALCCIVAVFAALSAEMPTAASAAAGAITSLILIAIGNIVSKVHSIQYYTRASYLLLEASASRAAAGARVE